MMIGTAQSLNYFAGASTYQLDTMKTHQGLLGVHVVGSSNQSYGNHFFFVHHIA